jgi:zinc protease
MLTGKTLSITPYIDRLEHGVSGSSSVKDLETALQIIYLYFADPRFDQKEYDNGISQITAVLPNLENQPNYKLQKELFKALYNTPRREMISAEKVQKASLATIEKNYRRLFADAAGATMVIVGDVDLDALKPLVEKYIGSIPKGKKAFKWVDTHEDVLPGRIEDVFAVDMQTPMSTVAQVWSAPLAYTEERQAALDAISYILDIRYTNSLREDEGGTYGASSQGMIQRRPTDQTLIQVVFACRPSLCDKLRSLAIEGIRNLAANGPTDDEVNSAVLNLKKNLPESRVNNSYWRGNIENYLKFGEDRDALREAAINGLTKESIQKFLQEILAADNFAEIVMKPANTAEAE